MTIHGESKNVTIPVSLTISGSAVKVNCDFEVALSDYKIKVPKVVSNKLSNEIKVKVNATLNPMVAK